MNRCPLCLNQIEKVYGEDNKCAQCYYSDIAMPYDFFHDIEKIGVNIEKRINTDYKICKVCKEKKPKDAKHFYVNGKSFRSVCKECMKNN